MRSVELSFAAEWDERKTDEYMNDVVCAPTRYSNVRASSVVCMKVSVFLIRLRERLKGGGETADMACQKY